MYNKGGARRTIIYVIIKVVAMARFPIRSYFNTLMRFYDGRCISESAVAYATAFSPEELGTSLAAAGTKYSAVFWPLVTLTRSSPDREAAARAAQHGVQARLQLVMSLPQSQSQVLDRSELSNQDLYERVVDRRQ